MTRHPLKIFVFTLAILILSSLAQAQAVSMFLSSGTATYCPLSTDAATGPLIVTAGSAGTIPGAATIQLALPAPLTAVPTFTTSPAVPQASMDTVNIGDQVVTIRFSGAATIAVGTQFQVNSIRLNVSLLPSTAKGIATGEVGGNPASAFTFSTFQAIMGRPDNNLCPVTVTTSKNTSSFRSLLSATLSTADTITVTSTDGRTFAQPTVTVSTTDGGAWINGFNGTVTVDGSGNTYTISILPQAQLLTAVGKYTGKVVINVLNTTNNPPLQVNVSLVVYQTSMAVNTTSLFFRASVGLDPASQTVTVGVTPPVTLPTVTVQTQSPVGSNWLVVSSSMSDTQLTLTVSPKVGGLAASQPTIPYAGVITLDSELAANTPISIIVQLQVDSQAPTLGLSRTSMDFTTPVGSSTPVSLIAVVNNTGGGTLSFTAGASTVNGGSWLSVNPTSGSAFGTNTTGLMVTANPTGLTSGVYTGTVTVTAAGAANSPLKIAVTLTVGSVPTVADKGIKQGASFSDGTATAGSILSLFGTNLATDIALAQSVPLPTVLAGGRVKVNGNPVPLFFASQGQINFQLPTELTGTSFSVVPSLNGVDGTQVIVPLVPAVPGLFSLTSDGKGPGAILKSDFTVIGANNPVAKGGAILIYGTGFGATNPLVASGQPAPGDPPGVAKLVATPTVTIGGQPAQVLFAGLAPGFVGLYQINATVPASVSSGATVPVVVTINNVTSNTVTIVVQ